VDIIEVMELLAPIRTHTFSDIPIPVISKGNRPMTVINVFTVAPDRQVRLLDLLTRATESSVRHVPGFVATKLDPRSNEQPPSSFSSLCASH